MKNIILIFIALFSCSVHACIAPTTGEKYDSLIKLKRIAKNQYQVKVPEYLEGLEKAEIMLVYSDRYDKGVPLYDPYDVLEINVKNGEATARFSIEKREKSKPYIVVMWWPKQCCLCGIQANSGYITPE